MSHSFFVGRDDIPAKHTNEKQRYFLNRAARIAMKSTMTHKHGAVIVRGDEIIAEGFNHHFVHMYHRFSIHAEADAIYKVKRHPNLPDCELYVVRIGPQCLKYSKPCADCRKCIEKHGIKKTYYSTNDAWKSE
jgi:deoxycytidylate deaminase